MASSKEEILLQAFLAVAGETSVPALKAVTDEGQMPAALDGATKQITALTEASQAQTQVLGTYARVVTASPVYQAAASGGEEQGTLAKVASAVLGNALGMVPLAKAIFGLFSGGGDEAPAPLVKYALPARMQIEAANGPGGARRGVDYGQTGLARTVAPDGRESGEAAEPDWAAGGPEQTGAEALFRAPAYGGTEFDRGYQPAPVPGSRGVTQVTVQVQAMDSRSFLDHKEDIARAVREAMLNSHSLNDVVSEV